KEQRPEDQDPAQIKRGRWRISLPDTQSAKDPKDHRDSAGDQKQVVKPESKKRRVNSGLKNPAVARIQSAANEKQWISEITEPHKRQRINRPIPRTTETLRIRVSTPQTNPLSVVRKELHSRATFFYWKCESGFSTHRLACYRANGEC